MQWSTAGLGRRWVIGEGVGGDGEARAIECVVSTFDLADWAPRHGVALSREGKGLESGVDAGPFLALSGGGPFPEFRVIV